MPHSDTPFKGILCGLHPTPLVWRNEWPDKVGWWWVYLEQHKADGIEYWPMSKIAEYRNSPKTNCTFFAGPITPPEMPK